MALLTAPAVHQIDERVADALDGRDVQLHRAAMRSRTPRAEFERALVGFVGVLHAKADGADRRAVQAREALGERIGFGVDEEVHPALTVQRHILVPVLRDGLEAQQFENLAQRDRIGGGVFDELETGRTHRIFPGLEILSHGCSPLVCCAINLLETRTQIVGSEGGQAIANMP